MSWWDMFRRKIYDPLQDPEMRRLGKKVDDIESEIEQTRNVVDRIALQVGVTGREDYIPE